MKTILFNNGDYIKSECDYIRTKKFSSITLLNLITQTLNYEQRLGNIGSYLTVYDTNNNYYFIIFKNGIVLPQCSGEICKNTVKEPIYILVKEYYNGLYYLTNEIRGINIRKGCDYYDALYFDSDKDVVDFMKKYNMTGFIPVIIDNSIYNLKYNIIEKDSYIIMKNAINLLNMLKITDDNLDVFIINGKYFVDDKENKRFVVFNSEYHYKKYYKNIPDCHESIHPDYVKLK